MKINVEKDRHFVDKGKVKVYSSVSGLSPLEDLYTIQKVIILPQGKEYTACKQELEYIFVMLTGKVQITGSALKKETISADSVLVVSQDIKRLTLKNNESVDAELLRVVIKRKEVPEAPIFQSLHPIDGDTSLRLLISSDAVNGSPLTEQPLWISKGIYTICDTFNYERKDIKNVLYIYIISGEVNINGNTLKYNDLAIFTERDESILTDFRKNTELLIIEKPVWTESNQ